jgi:uncharacterized heparinase superfamily protein
MFTPSAEIAFQKINKSASAENFPAADMPAPTAATYWRTLRHLRWSQLYYLALRRVLPRSHAPSPPASPLALRDFPGPWLTRDDHPTISRKILATREFTFLNRTVQCNGSIPWNDHQHAKLWLYHLNYFDFLNARLALPDDEPLLRAAMELMLDWRAHNRHGTEVGWEPYALSVRIVNWLKFLTLHARAMELREKSASTSILLESLSAQAATLERRLEKHLRGNHLVKNIKALLFAGALLETPLSNRWWTTGEALLEQELNEQILADGGHFERSPMYHAQVLEDLAEIRLLCAATEKRLACSALLAQKIQSMTQFMKAILHPDGEIPLFNDSTFGAARSAADLLAIADPSEAKDVENAPQVTVLSETGYGIIRNPQQRSALVFDCGPLGPDYQPGHGHCDVLSYELSLCGQRVVVDTGVSTYEPGPERSYERSTAAHNTLRIDGGEQAETWASFRVGRRPRVHEMRGGSTGTFQFVSGAHEGFQRAGVVHARTILLHVPDTWIVVDSLKGSGSHLVESFLHFHPSVRIEALAEANETSAEIPIRRWSVEFAGQSYLLATCGAGQFELLNSWYAEQFGNRQTSTALRWARWGEIPTGMVHVFTPAGVTVPRIAGDWVGNSIEIEGYKIPLR